MAGTILENLSGRKLTVLVSALLICQMICFLIGGLVAPTPSNVNNVLGTMCRDSSGNQNDTTKWFYARGKGACERLEVKDLDHHIQMANQIVFIFQIPLPRDGIKLDYSRWQQNLIGVLQTDILYHSQMEVQPRTTMTLDARLAYRNKDDPEDKWTFYASSLERRVLDCHIENEPEHYHYNCSALPLFELGSLYHDYYLLNIRLPMDTERNMNLHIGHVQDLWLTVINQNGGFTKVWVSLKTIFFPFIVGIMIWFWRRVHLLSRSPALLEYMLIYLGSALTFLNMPLEYLTLQFDMPYMLLLGDIRQGVFYATLLSFWLVFAGEHMLIQDGERNTLKIYWKHLSAVAIGCLSLLVFDMCERGVQLRNPFYSIWVTDIGTNLALTFIILAGISAGVYFMFLSYIVWRVFCNISIKQSSLPAMSSARRLHYKGIIYRFKFLMLTTLLCAGLTVVGFILGQVAEGKWKWDDNIHLDFTSAFFTGVYGMWNIYIFALIILYAPSHKKWPTDPGLTDNVSEEIEFSRLPTDPSPSEISSLTSFTRKSTID